jgi:dipeptidyl-peptidase-4
LAWHPDGKRFTFLRRSGGNGALDLWSVDATNPRATPALLLAGDRVQSSSRDAPGRPVSLSGYAWSPTGDSLLVTSQNDLFLVEVRSGTARALTQTPEAEEFPEFSPDGQRVAFVRQNDLYVVDVASGRETALTTSGSETVLNGRLDWVYEEELAARSGKAYAWSPDGRALAYLQLDQGRVPTFPIVDFIPVRNEVSWQRYPKAGFPNSIVRVGVVGLPKEGPPGPERLLSFDPDDMYVIPELAWSPDGRTVAFRFLNREQNELQLRLLPVPESPRDPLGKASVVLTERSMTWINVLAAPRFLKDGRRFLWLSERDGFAHLHVCETNGSCRAVTQGPWEVDARVSFAGPSAVFTVDERTGFVYFTATEKDPRERHLYRARLDGTGRARLTQEDGTHKVLPSPDGRFFADTWSDAVTPPRVWVSSQDGRHRVPIEDNRSPDILQYERGTLDWVDVRAKDGTLLHGMLVKPAGFDPARRYPVVVVVYGGPGVQTVQNAWGTGTLLKHLLASHGFLVWSLDNRGSSDRGRAFEDPIFRHLGKVELEDQLAGVEHLKSLPFVDASRLGIYGWSYGGYMTLYALTRAPAVFKAGVAGAPVADWKLYDTIYTERYMGKPEDNPEGYEASSPLAKADDLRSPLLVIHGTSDDNVHVANTMSFVDALIREGRPHTLMLHPRQMHAFSARENRTARDAAILRHLETYLRPN